MKAFLQKILGNYLAGKAGLYEGTPEAGKAWYKSKTVLAGICEFLLGLYALANYILIASGKPGLPEIPEIVANGIHTFLGVTVVKGRIDGYKPIVLSEEVIK